MIKSLVSAAVGIGALYLLYQGYLAYQDDGVSGVLGLVDSGFNSIADWIQNLGGKDSSDSAMGALHGEFSGDLGVDRPW